jgi:D-alanyl-D-alanine carboxypeptidase/D-alanyl-D-alanine-endopeptidase (penicillin-binding protein 4)
LLVDRSAPLSELIDVTLKWSRNEYAETLLRALSPPGKAQTAAGGLEVLYAQLAEWGVGPELYLARDGSGLSRMDYVSAEALTRILTHVWTDPKLADTFRSTLPEAGISGTLSERMKGTPAEAHVWAKTGTLSNVRGLSGYLITSAGEPIVFAMIANNFTIPTADVDAVMEKALNRVMVFTR